MNLNYVFINFSVFLILSNNFIFAQTEQPIKKPNYNSYAFNFGTIFLSPGIGFAKDTKKNFGADLEIGVSNSIGIVAGLSKATLDNSQKSFSGIGFGIRAHSISSDKSQNFDIAPGIYWTKILKYQNTKAFSFGIDFRLFYEKHLGVSFGISKAFIPGSTFSKSANLIFRLN
jgi:hypothetical protein